MSVVLVLAASAALSAEPIDPKDVEWLQSPSGRSMALERTDAPFEGSIVALCRVTREGRLERCRLEEVDPHDAVFKDMLPKLAPEFRMALKTRSGQPVAARPYRLTLRFQHF